MKKSYLIILVVLFSLKFTFPQSGTFTFDNATINSGVDPNTASETLTSSTPNVTLTVSSYSGALPDDIKKSTNNSYGGSTGYSVYTNYNQSKGVNISFSSSGGSVNITTMHVYVISSGTYDLVFTPNTGTAVTKTGVVGGSSGGADVTLNFVGITSFSITTTTLTTVLSVTDNFVNPGVDNIVMDASLPVELTSFTAVVNGSNVNLKWQTATEVQNYGFEVQRSAAEGEPRQGREVGGQRSEVSNWEKIGFVQGAGNSNSPKYYSFTDQPTGGTSFSYRLKQIDNDGHYKYYDAITVTLSSSGKAELMQNSPNPFNPTTAIKFFLPNSSDVTIKIYDMLGREVTTLVNNQTEAGYHIVYWNGRDSYGRDAASGVYLYRLTVENLGGSRTGSFSETKKMNLLK